MNLPKTSQLISQVFRCIAKVQARFSSSFGELTTCLLIEFPVFQRNSDEMMNFTGVCHDAVGEGWELGVDLIGEPVWSYKNVNIHCRDALTRR